MNTHMEKVEVLADNVNLQNPELEVGMECMTDSAENFVTPGGVDTVHCSFYCKFTERFMDHLRTIANSKRIAEHPSDREDAPEPVFECGERLYVVMPYGFNPNKGMSRYCYYQYVLKDGGITVAIQPRDFPGNQLGEESDKDKNKCPNVRVEIGALPLIIAGSMQTIMDEIEQRLKEMGLAIVKNRLGRVDVCADLPFHVRQLQYAVVDRRFISRTRSYDLHAIFDDEGWEEEQILPSESDDEIRKASLHFKGYTCTGFTIGRDKILCRGYDKLEKEKHNEDMLLCLAQRRCGGELWQNMTRIEFQIRREALRGMTVAGKRKSIETWQDFVKYQSAIVRYLCTEWLVFTDKEFIRSHSDRVKKRPDAWHPDWVKAVSTFKRAFGESEVKITRMNASIKREATEDIAQSIGCDQSALLKTDIVLSPYDPLWKHKVAAFRYVSTFHYLSDPNKEKAFWRNWNDKELEMDCRVPTTALSDFVPLSNAGNPGGHSRCRVGEVPEISARIHRGNILANKASVASKGAGVTHNSPWLANLSALLMTPGASGPAPCVIE